MIHPYFRGNISFPLFLGCLLLLAPVGLAQTSLVKDIVPGERGAGFLAPMVNVNGTLFFTANDQVSGYELWKSNGTAAGTVLVKDLAPGATNDVPKSSFPFNLTAVNGTLYFSANDALYKSDGTAAGTVLLRTFPGGPARLVNVNGTLYFTAAEAASGRELYKSDGTAAGTVRVKDIVSGPASSSPEQLTNVNGTLYFSVGGGLYKSNGTAAGTGLVKAFAGTIYGFTNLNGVLYFTDGDDVWRSNGTAAGTEIAADVPEGINPDESPASGRPNQLTASGERVYFITYLNPVERQLWSVGAGGATVLYTFSSYPSSPSFSNFADVNGTLFFMAIFGSYYKDLFAVTGDQVRKVKDFDLGGPDTDFLTNVNGTLFFANGGEEGSDETGVELWRSDGTEDGTYLDTDINPGRESGRPESLVNVNGVLFFTANDGTRGRELWKHVPGRPTPAFRVNAGGKQYTTPDARTFAADAYFSGGVVSTTTTRDIAGTGDDYLYQTGRHGASFSYNFPTGNGRYDVVLHFAETYWGNTVPGGVGSRRFDVHMEGTPQLIDYDIFARAGAALRVAQETFRVTVADGTLNIEFRKGAADNPAIKAIEVLPAGSALALNSGGAAFTTAAGKTFAADAYYAGGTVSGVAAGDIANTTDDGLYHTVRFGTAFSYGIPSGDGIFDVVLHFAETYWGARAPGGVGSRRFNVDVEGARRLTNYDIFAKAGGARRAVKETLRVTVTDGVLNLYFSKGAADNALISAIEILPATNAARLAGAEDPGEDRQPSLYPNPVRDQLTVALPFPAAHVKATAVSDARGKIHLVGNYRVSGAQEIQIGTQTLPGGFYLLRLDAQQGSKVLKFLKQ